MEELLYDLSLGIVNVDDKRLSEEEIKHVCERGYAFRLGNKKIIGVNYLKDYILGVLKKNEKIDNYLKIKDHTISPFLMTRILEDLILEDVAKKEENKIVANYQVLLSKETILNFCRYKIDALTIKDIVTSLGFEAFAVFYPDGFPKIKTYKEKVYSDAYIHCQKIVKKLAEEGLLIPDKHATDVYYWNDK